MWRETFDRTVNQMMQKRQVRLSPFGSAWHKLERSSMTDLLPAQLWMPGIGFDRGEETLKLDTLEMRNSKWKMRFADCLLEPSVVCSSTGDVHIIMKNGTRWSVVESVRTRVCCKRSNFITFIFALFGQQIVDVFEKVRHIQKEVKVESSQRHYFQICAHGAFVCPGRRSW